MSDLPDIYFRVRENGAAVFRVDTQNRQRRLEMTQIAVVNLRKGEVRAHPDQILSPEEETRIAEWMAERQQMLARRDLDDIHRTVDHLNLTAQWAQQKASDTDLEEITDRLLLAMHDLRSVLVRRKADRLMQADRTQSEDESGAA